MLESLRSCPICGAHTTAAVCSTDGAPTEPLDGFRAQTGVGKPGDIVAGRYRLSAPHRSGLHSRTFLAEHLQLGSEVLLELMTEEPAALDEVYERRFARAARLTAQLTSRHTTRVLDFGHHADGRPFVVTEYVPGRMLGDVVQWLSARGERMDLDAVCEIAGAVLKSLAEAHGAGLVHRNVQPNHILLCRPGLAEFDIKLTDFGLVRPTDSKLTKESTTLGAPAYMSPEQITGKDFDGRSDLYSLGVMLYLLVCGELPYNDPSPLSLIYKHVQAPVPKVKLPVRSRQAKFLAVAIERLLSKRPESRFADARTAWRAMEFIHASAMGELAATRQLLDDMEEAAVERGEGQSMPTVAAESEAAEPESTDGHDAQDPRSSTTVRVDVMPAQPSPRRPGATGGPKPAARAKRGGLGGLLDELE